MLNYFARVGLFGKIGVFSAVDERDHDRGERVLCRTVRGLEVGEVLSAAPVHTVLVDGQLLRRMTVEDNLLAARLEKYRDRAQQACCSLLEARQLPAVLIDVEQLFDGEALYFYFLGDPTPELDSVVEELADLYALKIEFRKFAETLADGCGPGCGTEQAENGCQSGACHSCALTAACHAPRNTTTSACHDDK